ncbi:hypothetical protein OAH81_01225 [Candidatus Pseudothioglobus singularis]|nr:hypothetical protein [Candidatus Pseudothioglobus singularis]MDB4821644.1 hypothetical protein [Candidatus Pseudothioglobus singularis]
MKRFALLSLIFISFGLSADTSKSKTINNLTVTVHSRDFVEVYKGDKHIFSFDCNEMYLCNIYTTTNDDPVYRIMDGMVYEQESEDLLQLTLDNVQEVVGTNTNFYDGTISFFVSYAGATGAYGNNTMYTINTERGSVSMSRREYYHYIYGMAKPAHD